MRQTILLYTAVLTLTFSCKSKEEEEKVNLDTFKEKVSYVLGADHSHSITEANDAHFSEYDIDEMVKGFEEGLKNDNAFDDACKSSMVKLLGENGQKFDAAYAKEGSRCLGKLSGVIFQTSWKKKGAMQSLDMQNVITGFRHGLLKKDTLVSQRDQITMIQTFFEDLNKMNGIALLDKAKKIPGAKITDSGLVLETIQEGSGNSPAATDDVLAHYILINSTGDTLQNSFDMVRMYQQPLRPFSLKAVVKGWQEGMPMMKKGGKYRLYVPYQSGYGEQGMFDPQSNSYSIQPYESLVFYIELIDYGKEGSLSKP